MKKVYVKPCVEGVEMSTRYGIMIGGSGEMKPSDGMAKGQDLVFDEDDDENMEEVAAVPTSFHSNDYLKKVWE